MLLVLIPLAGAGSSRAGTIVFAASHLCRGSSCDGFSNIYTVEPSGQDLRRLTEGRSGDEFPSISPDGRRVAFAHGSSLVVLSIGSSGLRTIYGGRGRLAWESSWSPDGTWIVFGGQAGDGIPRLYLIRPDGTGLHPIASGLEGGWMLRAPSWSADGRWIAYYQGGRPTFRIWVVHPNGMGRHAIPNSDGAFYPAWSPDGRLLAFLSNNALVVIHPDGTGRRIVARGLAGDPGPHFSPDGKSLVFARDNGGSHSLWITGVNGKGQHRLPVPQAIIEGIDWSRQLYGLVPAVQQMAPLKSSGARISAGLTKTRFLPSQAPSVKLVYTFVDFSHLSKKFSFLLTRKQGAKWLTVRSVKQRGSFQGGPHLMTVEQLFGVKPVTIGQYRLRLSADANSVLRGFEVVAPTLLSNAVAVSAGGYHTCAALADGTVRCWGKNSHGEIGDGTITGALAAVQVSGITNAVAVSNGDYHSCALLSNGTVECWGNNAVGQLGNGTKTPLPPYGITTPVQVSGILNAVALSAGSNHTCALLSNRTIECWGVNGAGELGNGTTVNSSTPVQVSGISNAVAVSAGAAATCALLSGGTVSCWGWNDYGALGDGTTVSSSTPVQVSGITNATAVSAGGFANCALLSGDTVDCWGSNIFGQLGDGTTTASSTPIAVSGISSATAISAGGFFGCALLAGGTIDCWGRDNEGQLGGAPAPGSTTVRVQGIANAAAISAGKYHACALLPGGAVDCWGSNVFGQLGNGVKTNSSYPVGVTDSTS